jgi:hypothetical protein
MVNLEDVFKKCSKSRPENTGNYGGSSNGERDYHILGRGGPLVIPDSRHGFRYVPLNSETIAKILEEIASRDERRKKVLEDIAKMDRLRRDPKYLN